MHPVRAFLTSFFTGLSLLLGGHALVGSLFPEPPLYAPARTA